MKSKTSVRTELVEVLVNPSTSSGRTVLTSKVWLNRLVRHTTLFIAALAIPCWAIGSFEQEKRSFTSSESLLLDRHGEVLHRLRTDSTVRRGQWVALADMSPALRTAMVLSEDKRFYEHSGVDWRAVSAAAWGNALNQRTRGASTLSMQLAGLIEDGPRKGSERRNVLGKASQAVSATWLEQRWRKDQILEAYLNLVPFRGEMQGIDALSRTLFGKAAHGLDEREAAITAALVRAPNASARVIAQRACGVLRAMQSAEAKHCDAVEAYTEAVLPRKAFASSDGIAPHVAHQLMSAKALPTSPSNGAAATAAVQPPAKTPSKAQASVRSTLDAKLQRFATQSLEQHLHELKGRNVEDGAVVVIDNASGELRAYVGSSGALGSAQEVDAAAALRQAGSTLKPFLYAQAIAEKRLTAASLVEDSSAHIPTASGLYIPQNYDRSFKGWVSVRTALGASLNVPAVRTLVMVSPDAFARQLRTLGLPLKNEGDYYGYSLALGSADVSLLSLANAYRALANGGRCSATSLVALPKPVFKDCINPQASFIVSDILRDPMARARTFGTDSVLATRINAAVKTGTSKDMRDNWAIGYSSRYTVGVWVGNASGESMWDVSGTSGAAPVWAAVMQYLHPQGDGPARPGTAHGGSLQAGASGATAIPPKGTVKLTIRYAQAQEAGREEWFVEGTEQPVVSQDATYLVAATAIFHWATGQKGLRNQVADTSAAKIVQPAPGSIVALDPDIPPQRQRLHLQATLQNNPQSNTQAVRWLLDGKPLAQGAQAQWLPWPGKHVITLVDLQGKALDEVRIEVRGAAMRTTTLSAATVQRSFSRP
jgi:penicillin-binding protein 1C